jgi:hypothetical protein
MGLKSLHGTRTSWLIIKHWPLIRKLLEKYPSVFGGHMNYPYNT